MLTFTLPFTLTFTAKVHLNTRQCPGPWQRPHPSTWEGKWWCVRSAEAKPSPRTDEPAPSGRSGICDHDCAHWTDEARAWGQRSLAPFNRPALLLLLCLPQRLWRMSTRPFYMLAVGPWGRLIDHVRQTDGKHESLRGSEFDSANPRRAWKTWRVRIL